MRSVTKAVAALLIYITFLPCIEARDVQPAASEPTATRDSENCTRPIPITTPSLNGVTARGYFLIRDPGYGGADPGLPITNLKPTVQLVVGSDGSVMSAELLNGTGSPTMDTEILKWANKYIFQPLTCPNKQKLVVVVDLSKLAVEP
jgi:hypothetical protein